MGDPAEASRGHQFAGVQHQLTPNLSIEVNGLGTAGRDLVTTGHLGAGSPTASGGRALTWVETAGEAATALGVVGIWEGASAALIGTFGVLTGAITGFFTATILPFFAAIGEALMVFLSSIAAAASSTIFGIPYGVAILAGVAIIGAAIEVHKALGTGLLESAYEACLCHELALRKLAFRRQEPVLVIYKSVRLDCGYVLDLLVEDRVVVELKAVESLQPVHASQLLTYLRLLDRPLGLLINFRTTKLVDGVKRVANNL